MASPIDAYLARLPPDQRAALERLRKQIHAAAPGATERISYQMPAFDVDGILVWIAAFEDHCSLFPGASGVALAKELGYERLVASKGTLRFTPQKPLPAMLVKKIVKLRLAENAARAAKRKTRKRAATGASRGRRAGARAR